MTGYIISRTSEGFQASVFPVWKAQRPQPLWSKHWKTPSVVLCNASSQGRSHLQESMSSLYFFSNTSIVFGSSWTYAVALYSSSAHSGSVSKAVALLSSTPAIRSAGFKGSYASVLGVRLLNRNFLGKDFYADGVRRRWPCLSAPQPLAVNKSLASATSPDVAARNSELSIWKNLFNGILPSSSLLVTVLSTSSANSIRRLYSYRSCFRVLLPLAHTQSGTTVHQGWILFIALS